jgi:hypothetical protein
MRKIIKFNIPKIFLTILMCFFSFNGVKAQYIKEPPIPLYFSNSQKHDSIKAANEKMIAIQSTALKESSRKNDSLQNLIQKSVLENTVQITWLYAFTILLIIINVVLLLSNSRLRKRLAQVKDLQKR